MDQFRSSLVLSGCLWHLRVLSKSFVKMCNSSGVTAILVLASCERPLCRSDPGSRARNIWSLAGPGGGENEGWRRSRNGRASPQRSAVECSVVQCSVLVQRSAVVCSSSFVLSLQYLVIATINSAAGVNFKVNYTHAAVGVGPPLCSQCYNGTVQ